jgi:cystathionine beta-lyase
MNESDSLSTGDPIELWPVVKPELPRADPVPNCGFETVCAHYAEDAERHFGAAAPPIYQTSTFLYPDAATFEQRRKPGGGRHEYTRGSNPTSQILEAKLARMERAEWADCFSSGMAAITAAINACVAADTHVVAVAHCYGPTRRYLDHLKRLSVETTFVAGVDPDDFLAAIRPNTCLIYLESPTSGRFEVPEIEPITRAARARGITTLFDNSWATPYFQNPLEMGVDLVLHSATKFLNGHSDVVAGVAAGRERKLRENFLREIELAGGILDPHAAWLLLRGLRTLPLRMERHHENGLAAARMLAEHPKVAYVLHPGLESHPQHATTRKQLRGYSGLFSFALREQSPDAMRSFLNRLKLFKIGVSWGGYESLAIGGTLFNVSGDRPERLIRLHVGLESKEDLLADLKQALEN